MIASTLKLTDTLARHQKVLTATTSIELKKRYAGSLLGYSWVALYPLLFLSVYLFLYLVVFNVSYPQLNTLESIIYIFTGLVPYIAFMETANGAAVILKQNMHLIKNVIMPIELIPTRVVLVALTTQCVGLGMILALCLFSGNFSWHLLYLPLALLLQAIFLTGLALIIAPIGVMLPDTGYFINILSLLLMFLSPIGYMSTMLPHKLQPLVTCNPIYYMIEPFRMTFLAGEVTSVTVLLITACIALFTLGFGSVVFKKFKNFLADYE